VFARGIEVLQAIDEAITAIEGFEPFPEQPDPSPRAGTGHSATEAPRGILYIAVETDAEGFVRGIRIVPPTSQNQAQIEADLRALAPAILTLPEEGGAPRGPIRDFDLHLVRDAFSHGRNRAMRPRDRVGLGDTVGLGGELLARALPRRSRLRAASADARPARRARRVEGIVLVDATAAAPIGGVRRLPPRGHAQRPRPLASAWRARCCSRSSGAHRTGGVGGIEAVRAAGTAQRGFGALPERCLALNLF
jgi:hypothetical protein